MSKVLVSNVKGPKGDKGDPGVKGDPGAIGLPGPNSVPTVEFMAAQIADPESPVAAELSAKFGGVLAAQVANTTVTTDVPRTPFSVFQSAQTRDDMAIVLGSSSASHTATQLSAALAPLGIAVHNGGVPGERGRWTEARIGSDPLLLTFPSDVIPASGSVVVTVTGGLPPSTTNPIPGRVSGVAGTVSVSGGVVTWARIDSGSSVPLNGPVAHIPTEGETYRDALHIIFGFPKNDFGGAGVDDYSLAAHDRIIRHIAAQNKRFIVVTPFCDTNTPEGVEKSQILRAVSRYKTLYGPVCFDLHGYLTGSQVWADTGITPTATDTAQQAAGNLPPSLAADAQHMNTAARTAVAARIYDLLTTGTGWFTPPVNPIYTSDSFASGSGSVFGRSSDAAHGGLPAPWIGSATGWNMSDGSLVDVGAASVFAGFTAPSSDCEIAATVKVLPTTSGMFLTWRRADSENLYRVTVSAAGALTLTKRVAATTSTISLATGALGSVVAGDVLTARMVGSVITILVNGVVRATANDTSHVSAGEVGIGTVAATGGASVDDVLVRRITDAGAL